MEFDGSHVPLNEQVRLSVGALFEANRSMVLPAEGFRGERLHILVQVPGRTVMTAEETIEVPASYDPYVIELSTAVGYMITPDINARLVAALTPEETKDEEAKGAWSTVTFITGNDDDPQPSEQSRWSRGHENMGVQTIYLDMGSSVTRAILNEWLNRLSGAIAYDPRTHGILRAPALPNELRTAPDRLATLEEIEQHKRAVWLGQRGTVRKWAEPALRILRKLKI